MEHIPSRKIRRRAFALLGLAIGAVSLALLGLLVFRRSAEMSVLTLPLGRLEANCYLVWDTSTLEALAIDPGGSVPKIAQALEERGLKLRAIALTHNHFDHSSGAVGLQAYNRAPIYMHKADEVLSESGIGAKFLSAEKRYFSDGDRLKVGGLAFEVLHTPGHSPGSVCLYHASGALFSGDLLFRGAVGRTDLPLGDQAALERSIREKLARLPDETRLYPGHGPKSTLGEERRQNPLFR